MDRYCVYVAAGITDLVNILGPEKVLIGGGISRQGETAGPHTGVCGGQLLRRARPDTAGH